MRNLPEQKLYIDGGYVEAASGERFETINPATGEVICSVQAAGETDVERAVAAAQKGFRTWSPPPSTTPTSAPSTTSASTRASTTL